MPLIQSLAERAGTAAAVSGYKSSWNWSLYNIASIHLYQSRSKESSAIKPDWFELCNLLKLCVDINKLYLYSQKYKLYLFLKE